MRRVSQVNQTYFKVTLGLVGIVRLTARQQIMGVMDAWHLDEIPF